MAPDFCTFIDASPSPIHAATSVVERLHAAGFTRLDLTAARWELGAGGWYIQQGAAVIAFRLRRAAAPTAWKLIGAHTDSPHLRLKPRAAFSCEHCLQWGVEVYGGVLLNSWLDRDLGLAGTVHAANGRSASVLIRTPLARVPQLAIHLDRGVNDGLKLNPQTQLTPIWGLAGERTPEAEFNALLEAASGLRELISHDLSLFDLTPATTGGAHGDLLFAARLDNLCSVFAGLQALLATANGPEEHAPVLACFDHEEVGSNSRDGAEGTLLATVLERVCLAFAADRAAQLAALSASLLLSADMAHAVHPNYSDRHEPRHKPQLGGGPVLKSNHNQRYATTAETAATVRRLAHGAEVPLQDFVARSDLGCGSTIGPAAAARLGIAVADLGAPMLSMHSARECMATADVASYVKLLTAHLGS